MKVIVDAMGGDAAPRSTVEGCIAAVRDFDVTCTLVGNADRIFDTLKAVGMAELPPDIELVHASETVTMEDNPATAFKEKKDSSLTVGLTLVRDGKGDAFVSAGSTGALLAGATLITKRIRGIRRAAMAPVLPTPNGGTVLIDCGATAEGTPEYLLQYALMGSYYANHVLKRPEPRVGLLNIGAEESKGTALARESYAALRDADERGLICFAGNAEADAVMAGSVDVVVCDGWSGNILLKSVEGTAKLMSGEMKKMFRKNLLTKISALFVSDGLKQIKKMLDPGEVGGTPILGISKPIIKAHGSSDAYAIRNAISAASAFAASGLIENLTENVSSLRAEK